MAWIHWKEKRAYIYERIDGKPKCVKALGEIGAREAEGERITWLADEGRDPACIADRTMESVYDEYVRYLIANDYSSKTIDGLRYSVKPFVDSMRRLKELTKEKCAQWDGVLQSATFWVGPKGQRTERPLSTESRANRLRTISAFCAWLAEMKYMKQSPFEVKIPEQRADAGRALKGSQVHALFDHWPTGRNAEKQSYADLAKLFFQILFYGGTRLSETLGYDDEHPGATFENVDRDHFILKLEKTKAGKAREVALPRHMIESIPKGTGPLFWGRISERTLRHFLKRAVRSAGITGRFRIHDARVTCATEWARKNRDPRSAMDQFGWKTEKMAMHYQKVATEERVAQAQNITFK